VNPTLGPKAVFDCVVFLQAVISGNGPAARLIGMAENGDFEVFVTAAILEELAEVLERPRLRAKSPRLTFELIDQFLDRVRSFATLVTEAENVVRLRRDPDDEIYVNLAIAVKADFIVTRDHDLLDLMRTEQRGEVALPERLRVVTPEEFLAVLLDRGIAP
jgi:uncharacterized protein